MGWECPRRVCVAWRAVPVHATVPRLVDAASAANRATVRDSSGAVAAAHGAVIGSALSVFFNAIHRM